jgi:hypothetical protein
MESITVTLYSEKNKEIITTNIKKRKRKIKDLLKPGKNTSKVQTFSFYLWNICLKRNIPFPSTFCQRSVWLDLFLSFICDVFSGRLEETAIKEY